MITQEMIAADAALSGLTEEQQNAILLMSKNDEEQVIGNRFREVYNQLDATIAKATGVPRNGDEKTYLYLERAANLLAEKANSVDGLNQKIGDLTKERDKLQKALEEAGDESTKKQLAQALRDLQGAKDQYGTLKTQYDELQTKHAAEVMGIRIDNELASAVAGLKFKAEFPQAAVDTLLKQALQNIKGMNPEFVDAGGTQRLVFKNEQGQTLQNPENHLEPFTAAELLKKELRAMGILDEGRQQTGTGTRAPQHQGGGGAALDVSMARTQREADDILHNQLNAHGLVRGSKEYDAMYQEAWKAANISSLPIQ